MATFVQAGDAIDYRPITRDVSPGDVIEQEDLIGVATLAIKAGTLGALAVTGVFDFPKNTGAGEEIAAGKLVYWDSTNKVAIKTAGVNKLLGKAVAAAGENDRTVRVRLVQ